MANQQLKYQKKKGGGRTWESKMKSTRNERGGGTAGQTEYGNIEEKGDAETDTD